LTVVLLVAGGAAAAMLALAGVTRAVARRVERAVPPSGEFVEVSGQRLHYEVYGTGAPTLLLVHGLGGNGWHFRHSLVERLARDFRVIVLDRPGSGYSTRAPGAAAGPLAQAETVAAFIRALSLDRPVLVGHSLGGAIALATAVAHPELVRALALVAPLTQVPTAVPEVFQPLAVTHPMLRWAIGHTLATPLGIVRSPVVLDTVFGPDPVPRDFALAGGGVLSMRPSAFISASTDLVAVPDDLPSLVASYPRLRLPVGILYGTADRILDPVHHGEGMRALVPHVHLDYVEGAGHMLPLTAPDRVAAFVRRVMDGAE
jgi:pimeloyl-ACP methyl ester carboxylesterase